jgi:hypothetical protein
MLRKAMTSLVGAFFLAGLLLLLTSGCASLVVNPMLEPLTVSLQKQTDLDLLRDGAPSLLLLIDALVSADPDNEHLLMTAAQAYGTYATVLYEDGKTERAVNMSIKARDYGISLIKRVPALEKMNGQSLDEIEQELAKIPPSRVGNLFWGAYGWAVWIQYQEGAPAALADLPIVEQIMLRVVELDESYNHGGAHIFLGSYYGSRPQMYGGNPEASREHFERALTINHRKFLLTQVAYARTYARLMYDRDLYLKLLTEVINRPLTDSNMAASNKLAKVMAIKLLAGIDEFF